MQIKMMENITTINIHICNKNAPKYMTQKVTKLKGEIRNPSIIFGDSIITFSTMERTTNA